MQLVSFGLEHEENGATLKVITGMLLEIMVF
jgi:hypothetical protein